MKCEGLSLVRAHAGSERIETMDEALFDNLFNKLLKWLVFILFQFLASVPVGTLYTNVPIGVFFSLERTKLERAGWHSSLEGMGDEGSIIHQCFSKERPQRKFSC